MGVVFVVVRGLCLLLCGVVLLCGGCVCYYKRVVFVIVWGCVCYYERIVFVIVRGLSLLLYGGCLSYCVGLCLSL